MRKGIVWKRLLSLMLTVIMLAGSLPTSIFTLPAVAAGTTYNGTTIDVLDGNTTAAKLYDAFKAKMGDPSTGGTDTLYGKTYKFGGTTIKDDDTATVFQGYFRI